MLLLTEGVERCGFAGLLEDSDARAARDRSRTAVEAAGALAPVGRSRGARDDRVRAAIAAFGEWVVRQRPVD